MGIKATEKAIRGNLNTGSLINKSEVFKFSRAIESWELRFFDLQGITDIQTKANLNEWLDEMEIIYSEGMIEANVQSGYGGYGITHRAGKLGFDFKVYREAYKNQILRLSNKDLTEARLLRNSLASSLGDNQWKLLYKEYDNFIKQSLGLSLDTIKKEFQKKAIYQDVVFFVDSLGRQWRPSAYSEMWARTRSREIEDDIMQDEMVDVGLDVVRINDVSTTTPICLQFENKFFSLNGLTPELPVLKIRPPFHPNGRHRMLPQAEFGSSMLSSNTRHNKKVSKLRKGWSSAEKKAVKKQEKWNVENRE